METITAENLEAAKAAATKAGRTAASTDILTRTKKVTDMTDEWIGLHGMRKNGKCGEALRKKANEFLTTKVGDDSVPTDALLSELGRSLLAVQSEYPADPYLSEVELGQDWSKYSLSRAIADISKNKRDNFYPTGFEGEVSDDMIKRGKENGGHPQTGGFLMPMDAPVPYLPQRRRKGNDFLSRFTAAMDERLVRQRLGRDMSASDFAQGGALIPTITMMPYIELLRNRMVLEWAGVKMLGGMSGNIVWPRQISSSTPSAVSEVQQLVASNPEFDQVRAEPHRVGVSVHWALQLVQQSLPNIEAVIYEDAAKSLAIKVDYLGLNGQGAGNECLGILNTPGINATALSATPTLQQIIQTETLIRQNNVYDPIVFLATSSSRGLLMSAPAAPIGSTITIGQQNCLWVSRGVDDEVMIGRPAMDSQQIPPTTLVTGAFEWAKLLMWGGINVVRDQYTLAESGQLRLIFNLFMDMLVDHPFAFTDSTGMSQ